VKEGGLASFKVAISPVPTTTVAQPYTMTGTAVKGVDYTLDGAPNQVVFSAGQSNVTIRLTALQDRLKEKSESAIMTINKSSASINIQDAK
jgi:Calx-beta domain-containing protein